MTVTMKAFEHFCAGRQLYALWHTHTSHTSVQAPAESVSCRPEDSKVPVRSDGGKASQTLEPEKDKEQAAKLTRSDIGGCRHNKLLHIKVCALCASHLFVEFVAAVYIDCDKSCPSFSTHACRILAIKVTVEEVFYSQAVFLSCIRWLFCSWQLLPSTCILNGKKKKKKWRKRNQLPRLVISLAFHSYWFVWERPDH